MGFFNCVTILYLLTIGFFLLFFFKCYFGSHVKRPWGRFSTLKNVILLVPISGEGGRVEGLGEGNVYLYGSIFLVFDVPYHVRRIWRPRSVLSLAP